MGLGKEASRLIFGFIRESERARRASNTLNNRGNAGPMRRRRGGATRGLAEPRAQTGRYSLRHGSVRPGQFRAVVCGEGDVHLWGGRG